MNICIDTNAYSEFKRGNSAVLSLFETANIGNQTTRNTEEFQEFLDQTGIELKSPDQDLAERFGIIVSELRKNGTPIPSNDIWIAAIALETGSRLITYDKHFNCVPGLVIIMSLRVGGSDRKPVIARRGNVENMVKDDCM